MCLLIYDGMILFSTPFDPSTSLELSVRLSYLDVLNRGETDSIDLNNFRLMILNLLESPIRMD